MDRKLLASANGKTYSNLIQPRPTMTDHDRKEPENCYMLLRHTHENKMVLNFCSQMAHLSEVLEGSRVSGSQLKELLQKEAQRTDGRRKADGGYQLDDDDKADKADRDKDAKKTKKKRKKGDSSEEEQLQAEI